MLLLLGYKGHPLLRPVYAALTGRVDLLWLDHHDLIFGIEIDDQISRTGDVSIHWSHGGKDIVPNKVVGVLNELNYFPLVAFEPFHEEDREYAAAEYTAYFNFALSHFPNVLNPPACGTLSGFARSLPYQWLYVSKHFPFFDIPLFHFGISDGLPERLRKSHNLIVSNNVYDTRYWKITSQVSLDASHYSTLSYERPHGEAVFCTIIDEAIWVYDTKGEILNDNYLRALYEPLIAIASSFSLRTSTILLFNSMLEGSWTFGSITPSISISSMPPKLQETVIASLANTLMNAK